LPCKSCDALCAKNEKLQHETSCLNKHVEALRRACDNLDFENDELRSSLANMQSEIDLLKSNTSMSCNSCVAFNINVDVARSKIALLETSASLPCVSCESLLAEINELKLTHTTCVDELEHARAEICDMKSMPCSKCSLSLVEDACHASCDDDNALRDVNVIACSCDFVCTSCIDLESEVLALKTMREDMSAKLVEHDEMSANLEKENELLRTTYSKCIEEEINNLRNMTCGTCECLKSQNEVLRTRCKSLCAKSLDSRFSCHSDVDASKFASSKPERLLLLSLSLWMVVSVLVLWIDLP
jgi:regulator of replication initiation timing